MFTRLIANEKDYSGNSVDGTSCVRSGVVHAHELTHELKKDFAVAEEEMCSFGFVSVSCAGLTYAPTTELLEKYANRDVGIRTHTE